MFEKLVGLCNDINLGDQRLVRNLLDITTPPISEGLEGDCLTDNLNHVLCDRNIAVAERHIFVTGTRAVTIQN
jgi:hypothetical protein